MRRSVQDARSGRKGDVRAGVSRAENDIVRNAERNECLCDFDIVCASRRTSEKMWKIIRRQLFKSKFGNLDSSDRKSLDLAVWKGPRARARRIEIHQRGRGLSFTRDMSTLFKQRETSNPGTRISTWISYRDLKGFMLEKLL
jgi:hypothetical protein